MLRIFGDFRDWKRRCVAGEDRAVFRQRLELGEDFPLHVEILDHRLDDQIRGVKAAPIRGCRDPGDFSLHLTAAHPPALDLLAPDFRCRLQPPGEGFPIDVLHSNGGVRFVGDDVSDAPTHHARA